MRNINNFLIKVDCLFSITFRAFLHVSHQKQYEQVVESAHIQPFRVGVWIAIGGWIIMSGLSVLFIQFLLWKFGLEQNFIVTDYMFISFEAFTNQCGSKIPEKVPICMCLLMARWAALLTVTVYSTAVLSFVTVKSLHYPFQDIEGLMRDGTFKIGYENNQFPSAFFRVSRQITSEN